MPSVVARFALALTALILGAVIVVVVFAFSRGVVEAIATGAGCAAVLLALTANALPRLGAASRGFHVVLALIGAWTILVARVFGQASTVKWLSLADGAALLALGFVLLVVHEVDLVRRASRAIGGETTLAAEAAVAAANGNCHVLDAHRTGSPARLASAPVAGEQRRP